MTHLGKNTLDRDSLVQLLPKLFRRNIFPVAPGNFFCELNRTRYRGKGLVIATPDLLAISLFYIGFELGLTRSNWSDHGQWEGELV